MKTCENKCYNRVVHIYHFKARCLMAALVAFALTCCFSFASAAAEPDPECLTINSTALMNLDGANFDIAVEGFKAARECFLKSTGGEETIESATMINNIAEAERSAGDYESALQNYQKALDIIIPKYGEDSSSVATIYNNIGLIMYERGQFDGALEKYFDTLRIEQKLYGDNSENSAVTYNNIGAVYYQVGKYSEAIENYERALKVEIEKHGETSPQVGYDLNNIGEVYRLLGKYQTALDYYDRGVRNMTAAFGENHPGVALLYNNIGETYRSLGDYDKALEYHNNALKIRLSVLGAAHPDIGQTYNNVGVTHYDRGDFALAAGYYEKAIKIELALFGENHPTVANRYSNIGLAYKGFGDYAKALDYLLKALDIREATLGPEHPDCAETRNSIGVVLYENGEYQAALRYYKRALEISEKALGPDHPDVALRLNNIATVYGSLGDYAKAIEYMDKSLAIEAATFGKDSPNLAPRYRNIGAIYATMGEYEKSLENYKNVFVALCRGKAAPAPEDCRPDPAVVDAFWWTGQNYAMTGKFAIAGKYYEDAAATLDRFRGAVESEESKTAHGGVYYEMFPEGVGVFWAMSRQSGDKKDLERAVAFAEKGIGRVFLEMIGRSRANVDGGLPRAVLVEGRVLREQLRSAQEAVAAEEGRPRAEQTQATRAALYKQLQLAEEDMKAYEIKLLTDYPEYAELMNPPTRPLSEIRETVIGDGEAALEYYVGRDSSYVIFITDSDISVAPFLKRDELENLVNLYRAKLTNPAASPETIKRSGDKLSAALLDPIKDKLAGVKKLLIVPTETLFFVPFETLPIESGGQSLSLAEVYDVRYAPSLNSLYLVSERREQRGDNWKPGLEWLGFGDPVYQKEDERAGGRKMNEDSATMATAYTRAMAEDGGSGAAWGRIPGTGEEARAIATLFGIKPAETTKAAEKEDAPVSALERAAGGSKPMPKASGGASALEKKVKTSAPGSEEASSSDGMLNIGLEANEAKFKRLAPRGERYLHIASHGTLGEGGARQPALVLSLVGNDKEDGFLTMEEIFNMNIPAGLVTLSACKTGQGAMSKGEGVAGLSRAFLHAGADSLVVSLWSVPDKETAELMTAFYKNMRAGARPREALLEAKRGMIKAGLAPYYWAPFIFLGSN